MNCDECDHLLKTKLDEKFKKIHKCHHQKYLNTKPINRNNCLDQKCTLIIEKDNDNIEICIAYIIYSKVGRNEETESVRKTNLNDKPTPEKSTNYYEIQRNFEESENDHIEKNQLIVKSGLIRKIRLISKFMTSQPGQQTIAAHILPNISRSE